MTNVRGTILSPFVADLYRISRFPLSLCVLKFMARNSQRKVHEYADLSWFRMKRHREPWTSWMADHGSVEWGKGKKEEMMDPFGGS